jgi:membrane-associated protein
MEILAGLNPLDIIFHLKAFMDQVVTQYHSYVYLILFAIIFCETGLVVTPFLPGDSLLFLAGSLAAATVVQNADGTVGTVAGPLDLKILLPVICLAPILGDSANYLLGRFIGPRIFHKEKVRFLNREHLDRAHAFYGRHGGKAVAIGRFLPIIRTFVPFVAGIGKMYYPRFLVFSIVGTIAWINLCILAGYFLGCWDCVKNHFEMVVMAIIVITLLPAIIGFIKTKMDIRKERLAAQKDKKEQPVSTLKED